MLMATLPTTAQDYGECFDSGSQLSATGNDKTFGGKCAGKDVSLVGDNQTVTLHGACGSVKSLGNGKHGRLGELAARNR